MSELTKKDILLMIKIIKANYSYAYQNSTTDDVTLMANVWYDCLKQYPQQVVNEAFKKSIQTNKYPPTVADIIEQINIMQSANEKTEQELWNELYNALCKTADLYSKFSYTAIPLGETKTQGEQAREELKKVYNNLDNILKDYVSSIGQLIILSGSSDLMYEKGRFMRAIPNLRLRQKTKQQTPTKILNMLDNCLKSINITKKLNEVNN